MVSKGIHFQRWVLNFLLQYELSLEMPKGSLEGMKSSACSLAHGGHGPRAQGTLQGHAPPSWVLTEVSKVHPVR